MSRVIADHILLPYPVPTRPFDFSRLPFSTSVISRSPTPRGPEHFSLRASRRGLGDYSFGGISIPDLGGELQTTVNGLIQTGWNSLTGSIQNAIANRSGGTVDPVPVQNQVTANVLAPVSNALQMSAVVNSAAALQALQTFLSAAHENWVSFLRANWSSRAEGAYNTLEPYFTGLSTTINTDLVKIGQSGGGGLTTIPGTDIPYPQQPLLSLTSPMGLLLIGIGAYFLLSKGRK